GSTSPVSASDQSALEAAITKGQTALSPGMGTGTTPPPASGAPAVTGLSPVSGTTAGGDTVILSGTGFPGATAVNFGALAAASYTVDSDTQITAVSPNQGAAPVAVTVTTAAGTSAGTADTFTYA